MAHDLSPLKASRRKKILEIAERHFSAFGFRGSSIEAIAEAAGISKVTLYGYFASKDALFAAVAEEVAVRIEAAVMSALGGQGAADARIAAALIAKHHLVYEVVRSSPSAVELFAAKNLIAGSLFSQLDGLIRDSITGALIGDGWDAVDADVLAGLLFAAAQGVSNAAHDSAAGARDIARLVRALLQVPPSLTVVSRPRNHQLVDLPGIAIGAT